MDERPRSPTQAGSMTSADLPVGNVERQVEAELDELLRLPADVQMVDAVRADLQLVDAIRKGELSGQRWSVVEDALIEYGYQVITALLRTNFIFQRCREHGLRLPAMPIPPSEQEDLAQETVVEALRVFKEKVATGQGWDPAGGASVRTFFTRGLLFQFANIWRKRLRTASVDAEVTIDELVDLPAATLGPHELCAQRDEIRRGLADIDSHRTRAALVLTSDGYEQEEIAEILGVTPRAVEGYMRRHRQRTQRATQEGGR